MHSLLAAQSLDGIWQSHGSALVFQIQGDDLQFFQYSETSMLATGGTTIPDGRFQADPRTTLILSRVGEQLAISDEDATFTIQFDPLATLPPLTQSTRDPVRNFDLLVELFEKNHALFEAQYFILYTSALSR